MILPFRWHVHESIVRWLYSLGDIKIHSMDDFAFHMCRNDHLLGAQWLSSLGGVDIHAMNDEAFIRACDDGYLSMAKWLYSIEGISMTVLQSCTKQTLSHHEQIQSWLQSIIIIAAI
jgi:hypothetical protein